MKYTLAGDANLDGQVDWNDGYAIDSGRTSFPAHRYSWAAGNLDYNAFVDSNDYIPFNYTFGLTMADPNLVRVFQPQGIVLTLPENTAWSGDIATFTDSAHPGIAPTDYQALVSWGAGFTLAQVTADPSHPGGYRINTLSPNLPAGSTVMTITVQYAPGATDGDGNQLQGRPAAVSEPVTITPAVTNLSATAASSTSINLTWTVNSSNAAGFEINRATDPGFATFTTITLNSATATAYADTAVLEGRHYYYRIRAIQGSGDSMYSNTADAWTIPNAPSGLAATAAGPNQVNLSWTNNSVITQFQVERSDDGTNFYPLDTVTGTSYQDIFVADATSYTYRVEAMTDSGLTSQPSNTASASTPLAAPSDLSATGVSASEIDLTWVNNSAVATGVTVQWSSDGSNWSDLAANLSADTSSYNDTGLSAGTQRYYRVLALGASQQAPSNTSNATTAPPAPTGVTASAAAPTAVTLNWIAAQGATSYEVDRTIGGVFVDIADVDGGTYSFTESGLLDNTPYTYQVIARNDAGSSSPVSASTSTPMAPPDAPTGVAAVALSPSSVQLIWVNGAYNEQGFHIIYSDNNGQTWSSLADPSAGTTTLMDSGAGPGKTRQYQISAYNAAGDSAWLPASATNPTVGSADHVPPDAPTNFHASLLSPSGTQVRLTWSLPASGLVSVYWIERQRPGGNWAVLTMSSQATCDVSQSVKDAAFNYRVRAVNDSGMSPPSNTDSVTIPPDPPPAPSGGSRYDGSYAYISGYTVNLHWEYDRHENPIDGFHIYLNGAQVGSAGPDDHDFLYTFQSGTTYGTFDVRAYSNRAGESTSGLSIDTTGQDLPTDGPTPVLNGATVDANNTLVLDYTGLPNQVPTVEFGTDATHFFGNLGAAGLKVTPGATVYVRIFGVNPATGHHTAYSQAVKVQVPTLTPPTGVTAHSDRPFLSDGGDIDVTWNAFTDGSVALVERSEDGQNWRQITSGNSASFADVPLEGSHDSYRVRRRLDYANISNVIPITGYSDYSEAAQGDASPHAPLSIGAYGLSATSVKLFWADASGGDDGVYIDRTDTYGTVVYDTVHLTGGDLNSYIWSGLNPGTAYSFQVRATHAGAYDSLESSNIAHATTASAPPSVSIGTLFDAAELGPDGNPQSGWLN